MVAPPRLELGTFSSGGKRAIQLRYGATPRKRITDTLPFAFALTRSSLKPGVPREKRCCLRYVRPAY